MRRLRAILFVDVVDSVGTMSRDEAGFISRWRSFLNAVIHEDLPRWRGRMVKPQGDGLLVEFESPQDAVSCALDMQARIQRSETGVSPERAICLRTGINFGEVVSDG